MPNSPSMSLGQAVRLLVTPPGWRSLIMVLFAGAGLTLSAGGGAFQPLYFLPISLILIGVWFLCSMLGGAPQEHAFQRRLRWNAVHLLPLALLGMAAETRYLGWPTRMTSLFVGLSFAGVVGTVLVRLPEALWNRAQRALDHRLRLWNGKSRPCPQFGRRVGDDDRRERLAPLLGVESEAAINRHLVVAGKEQATRWQRRTLLVPARDHQAQSPARLTKRAQQVGIPSVASRVVLQSEQRPETVGQEQILVG